MTRIESLRLAPNLEIHQRFRNRADLIRLGDGGGLGQHQSPLTAPQALIVYGPRPAAGAIEPEAEAPAIDFDPTRQLLRELSHKSLKRGAKLTRIGAAEIEAARYELARQKAEGFEIEQTVRQPEKAAQKGSSSAMFTAPRVRRECTAFREVLYQKTHRHPR